MALPSTQSSGKENSDPLSVFQRDIFAPGISSNYCMCLGAAWNRGLDSWNHLKLAVTNSDWNCFTTSLCCRWASPMRCVIALPPAWMELIYLHKRIRTHQEHFLLGSHGVPLFQPKKTKRSTETVLCESVISHAETWLFLCSHRTRFACDLKAPCEISKVLKHVSAIFHRLSLILYVEEQYLLWQWSESNQIKAVRNIINIVVALLQLVDSLALCAQSNPQCQLTKEQKYNTPQTSANANHVNTCHTRDEMAW